MSNKIIITTEQQMQDNSALALKSKQETDADNLELNQKRTASDLLNAQIEHPEKDIRNSERRAAEALRQSQNDAAASLLESQKENAQILKAVNLRSSQKLKEKNQIINYLSGGYSVYTDSDS